MFHLMIEWRATNPRDETEVRMANTLRSAAVSITITSLTELLAFCIGATSPFLGVRNFCACSGTFTLLTSENKKLSYCWETVRRESMPRIAEMDVEMTT